MNDKTARQMPRAPLLWGSLWNWPRESGRKCFFAVQQKGIFSHRIINTCSLYCNKQLAETNVSMGSSSLVFTNKGSKVSERKSIGRSQLQTHLFTKISKDFPLLFAFYATHNSNNMIGSKIWNEMEQNENLKHSLLHECFQIVNSFLSLFILCRRYALLSQGFF